MNMSPDDMARMSHVLRHRLRNYASGIKTSAMLLSRQLKDRLAPSELEYFPLIIRECDSLAALTERLSLLFEELPAPAESAIGAVLDQVLARLRQRAPTVQLRTDIAPDVPARRVKAGAYLSVCLEEILTNACEASPASAILLRGVCEADGVRFQVVDDGTGVEAGAMNNLFMPFYSTKSRHEGIGLAIARRLARAMGGEVCASGAPRGGLAVEVNVPAQHG